MKNQPQTIQLKNIHFQYQNNVILENISLSIERGDYVGILGPNGGGKTTLLKIITGLLRPTSGEISIFGKNPLAAARSSWLGYVPQTNGNPERPFPATVREIVISGLVKKQKTFRKLTKEQKETLTWALTITGVEAFQNKLISNLSGGQKQRAIIARALVAKPEILLLDEPTSGIDASGEQAFYALLQTLHKKYHITILIVSHDIDIIANQVNTIVCLNKTLACHVPTHKFQKKEYLENMYGKNMKIIHHKH